MNIIKYIFYSFNLAILFLNNSQTYADTINLETEIKASQEEHDSLAPHANSPDEKHRIKKILTYLQILNHMTTEARSPSPPLLTTSRPCMEESTAPKLRIGAPPALRLANLNPQAPPSLSLRSSTPPTSPTTPSSPSSPNTDIFLVDAEKKGHILEIIDHITHLYDSRISGKQIFNLYRYIEENRSSWSAGKSIEPFYFTENQDPSKEHVVRFGVGEQNKLYIQFEENALSSGAAKVLHQVTSYGTWEKLAFLTHHSADTRAYFLKEQAVLKAIQTASNNGSPTNGLVETIEIRSHFTIQKLYDDDLLPYIEDPSTLSKAQKIQVIYNISEGVKNLHNLGFVHADIKPENILIEKEKKDTTKKGQFKKAVVTDFDISFHPQKFLNDQRDRDRHSFTTAYSAPEILEYADRTRDESWIGETNQAKIENAKKSDVFALGTVAQMLFNGKAATSWANPTSWPASGDCTRRSVDDPSEFRKCQKQRLVEFQAQSAKAPTYNPLTHLIAQSVQILPENRMSSEAFYKGIEYIRTRAAPDDSRSGISADEYQKAYSHFPNSSAISLSPETIHEKLKGAAEKSYLISPETTEKGIFLRLSFVGAKESGVASPIRSQIMDIDPRDPKGLEREIEYLKLIQVL